MMFACRRTSSPTLIFERSLIAPAGPSWRRPGGAHRFARAGACHLAGFRPRVRGSGTGSRACRNPPVQTGRERPRRPPVHRRDRPAPPSSLPPNGPHRPAGVAGSACHGHAPAGPGPGQPRPDASLSSPQAAIALAGTAPVSDGDGGKCRTRSRRDPTGAARAPPARGDRATTGCPRGSCATPIRPPGRHPALPATPAQAPRRPR